MKKIHKRELLIGISVAAAIAILVFGIEFLKGVNLFKPANYYIGYYSNIQGLETAAPVTVDGFKVGQVREINFNYACPGKIEVVMSLDKQLRIPEDSKAIIASSLLSGAYIELHLGASSKMLEVGDSVGTTIAPDLMASLSNDIMPTVNNILPKIDSILTNLATISSNPAIGSSLERINLMTGDLQELVAGLNKTLSAEVPAVMHNARQASVSLDTITADLVQLSARLKALPLESVMSNVDQTTAELREFSTQLGNPNSSLGKLTNDPTLYDNLTQVTYSLDSLIVDIKRNPKRYISIKLL